jgi:transcriptional regulator with XRE-family HTH domain
MPRWIEGRRSSHERWVAERIQRERAARGWSYEAVANAMADVGCPLPASAVFKIEKGDPPRKISLDEFLAFAQVFGMAPDHLMAPPEAADEEETARLLEEVTEASERVEELGAAFADLLGQLGAVRPDLTERIRQDVLLKLRLQLSSTATGMRLGGAEDETSRSARRRPLVK